MIAKQLHDQPRETAIVFGRRLLRLSLELAIDPKIKFYVLHRMRLLRQYPAADVPYAMMAAYASAYPSPKDSCSWCCHEAAIRHAGDSDRGHRDVLAAAIVRFEPAVVVASCWPNKAMLAIAVASASVGCCLGVVTGLFGGGDL
jgi:hypothetical protein